MTTVSDPAYLSEIGWRLTQFLRNRHGGWTDGQVRQVVQMVMQVDGLKEVLTLLDNSDREVCALGQRIYPKSDWCPWYQKSIT